MPPCINDASKRFKGDEPSPKGLGFCAHAEKVGTRRKGRDGTPWIVETDGNGRKSWRRRHNATPPYPDDQQRCINEFVRYEKSGEILQGQNVRAQGGKRMIRLPEGRIVVVPSGYRRVRASRKWIAMTFCQPSVDEDALRNQGHLEFAAWKDVADSDKRAWLTLADVKRTDGTMTIKVLSFHRNAGDHSADADINERGKAMPPKRFFRMLACTVKIHNNGATGALTARMKFDNEDDDEYDTNLEVEYRPGYWYPLDDRGYLPSRDPQSFFGLLGRKVHWTALDLDTRIGWRGGFLRPSALAHLPKVYYV